MRALRLGLLACCPAASAAFDWTLRGTAPSPVAGESCQEILRRYHDPAPVRSQPRPATPRLLCG